MYHFQTWPKFTTFKLPFPAVPNLSQTKLHLQIQNDKINLRKVYSVYVNNSYASAFYAVLVRSLCAPFINMHKSRVRDVTYCYKLGKKRVPPY